MFTLWVYRRLTVIVLMYMWNNWIRTRTYTGYYASTARIMTNNRISNDKMIIFIIITIVIRVSVEQRRRSLKREKRLGERIHGGRGVSAGEGFARGGGSARCRSSRYSVCISTRIVGRTDARTVQGGRWKSIGRFFPRPAAPYSAAVHACDAAPPPSRLFFTRKR